MFDKTKKIAVCAFIFALVALSQATAISTILTGITCVNCTLDNPTFVNYTFPSGGGSDNQKVNKSGDTMSGNLIVPQIFSTYLYSPIGESIYLHSQSSDDNYARIRLNGVTPYISVVVSDGAIYSQTNFSKTGTSFTKPIDMLDGNITNINTINPKKIGKTVYASQYPTIQAAINNLTTGRTYMETVIIDGLYNEGNITIPSNTKIVINGKVTLPTGAQNQSVFIAGCGVNASGCSGINIEITGGIIDGNRGGVVDGGIDGSQTAIYGKALTNLNIHDIKLQNTEREGLYISNSGWGNYNNIYIYNTGRSCFEVDSIRYSTIVNPKLQNCGLNQEANFGAGLDIVGGNTLLSGGVSVYGGIVYNSSGYGLRIINENGTSVFGLDIRDSGFGYLNTDNPQGILLKDSRNILLDGITVRGSMQQAVIIYRTHHSKVINSFFEGNSELCAGCYFTISFDEGNYNLISGNDFGHIVTNQTKSVGELDPNDDYNEISGNDMSLAKTLTLLGNNSAAYNNMGISPYHFGNHIYSPSAYNVGDTYFNTTNKRTCYSTSSGKTNWICTDYNNSIGFVTNNTMNKSLSGYNNDIDFVTNNTMNKSLSSYNNDIAFVTNNTMNKSLSGYNNDIAFVTNGTIPKDNNKVNKSGDIMTGYLGIGVYPISPFQVGNSNISMRVDSINTDGLIALGLNTSDSSDNKGLIVQGGGLVQSGVNSRGGYFVMYGNEATPNNGVVRFAVGNTTGSNIHFLKSDSNEGFRMNGSTGIVTISNLSGTGNAYVCVDSTGKLYRRAVSCV